MTTSTTGEPTRDSRAQDPQPSNEPRRETEQVVGALFDVGRLWAAHGLRVGRLALETSAATLKVTAQTLGDISQRLGERAAAPGEPEADRGADAAPR